MEKTSVGISFSEPVYLGLEFPKVMLVSKDVFVLINKIGFKVVEERASRVMVTPINPN